MSAKRPMQFSWWVTIRCDRRARTRGHMLAQQYKGRAIQERHAAAQLPEPQASEARARAAEWQATSDALFTDWGAIVLDLMTYSDPLPV